MLLHYPAFTRHLSDYLGGFSAIAHRIRCPREHTLMRFSLRIPYIIHQQIVSFPRRHPQRISQSKQRSQKQQLSPPLHPKSPFKLHKQPSGSPPQSHSQSTISGPHAGLPSPAQESVCGWHAQVKDGGACVPCCASLPVRAARVTARLCETQTVE